MKIIRYRLKENSLTKLGCVKEDKVYNLVGDPLIKAEQGDYVASLKSVELMAPCLPGKIISVAIVQLPAGKFYPAHKEAR